MLYSLPLFDCEGYSVLSLKGGRIGRRVCFVDVCNDVLFELMNTQFVFVRVSGQKKEGWKRGVCV